MTMFVFYHHCFANDLITIITIKYVGYCTSFSSVLWMG